MTALTELLDDGARFHCEYRGGLSNHLPMALVALQRLGAGDRRLRSFARIYSRRLEAAPPAAAWPAGDAWQAYLGDIGRWPIYRDLFGQWLAHEGAQAVLEQALPALVPGCGAAAFHGLIRVAYGVEAEHAGEIADGLAYWAARHLPLGRLAKAAGREVDPAALLRTLAAGTSRAGLIFVRMRDAAGGAAWRRAVARLAIDGGTPERLARAAAFAYAHSGNFTALHLVTSGHAMRVLAPFAPPDAWCWYWLAFAAGVVAAGLVPKPAAPLLGWPRLAEAALASDDDHLIKLVYSCREEERAYGGDDWRAAASRALAQART